MSAQTQEQAYLTIGEIAARYRKPVKTIRYWRQTGYGPRGTRVGSTLLYPISEVERFDRQLAEQVAAS